MDGHYTKPAAREPRDRATHHHAHFPTRASTSQALERIGAPNVCAVRGGVGPRLLQALPGACRARVPGRVAGRRTVAGAVRPPRARQLAAAALINAIAWVLIARLFDRELGVARNSSWCWQPSASARVDVRASSRAWYRGASGVLHYCSLPAATTWLRHTVARLGSAHLHAWAAAGARSPAAGSRFCSSNPEADPRFAAGSMPTVPQAHLFGAAVGNLAGAFRARQILKADGA